MSTTTLPSGIVIKHGAPTLENPHRAEIRTSDDHYLFLDRTHASLGLSLLTDMTGDGLMLTDGQLEALAVAHAQQRGLVPVTSIDVEQLAGHLLEALKGQDGCDHCSPGSEPTLAFIEGGFDLVAAVRIALAACTTTPTGA